MFNKLRIQLTLINLVIIAVLFLILTTGSYFFAQNDMSKHSEFFLRKMADSINSGTLRDLPFDRHWPPGPPASSESPGGPPVPPGPPGPNGPGGPLEMPRHFFVETDTSGNITRQSSNQLLDSEQLITLVNQTLQADKEQGTIHSSQNTFAYYRTGLRKHPGTLIVFEDIEQREHMLKTVLIALIVTGVICLILSLLGSLWLAGRALIPIQKAWQQQKDFVADASHELRTPLAVIQTNLEAVLSSEEETVASQAKWLGNIQEETEQMGKLVNSLLFLARADSHQQLIEKKSLYLGPAVILATELFEPLAAARGIALEVSAESPIIICGDEAKIRQVVTILLDNAFRHTPPGGKVTVRILPPDKEAILTIADTGEGIDPSYIDKIFDRFYQVDKARARGGAGLGLAIAKWIVESHKGRIQVASAPGVGTKFTIQLPLA